MDIESNKNISNQNSQFPIQKESQLVKVVQLKASGKKGNQPFLGVNTVSLGIFKAFARFTEKIRRKELFVEVKVAKEGKKKSVLVNINSFAKRSLLQRTEVIEKFPKEDVASLIELSDDLEKAQSFAEFSGSKEYTATDLKVVRQFKEVLANQPKTEGMKEGELEIAGRVVPYVITQEGEYLQGKQLGSGTYKAAHLALNFFSGEQVALLKANLIDSKKVYVAKKEVELLNKFKGQEGVAQLQSVDYLQSNGQREQVMIQKLYNGGELRGHLKKLNQADTQKQEQGNNLQKAKISHDILKGLITLHANRVIHSDLKPENVFVSQDPISGHYSAVIGDLGIASDANKEKIRSLGTPFYQSPNRLKKAEADEERSFEEAVQDEVFEVALVLLEIQTGLSIRDDIVEILGKPFPQRGQRQFLVDNLNSYLSKKEVQLQKANTPEAKLQLELLKALAENPDSRPTLRELEGVYVNYLESKGVEVKRASFDNDKAAQAITEHPAFIEEGNTAETVRPYGSGTYALRNSSEEGKFVVAVVGEQGNVVNYRITIDKGEYTVTGLNDKTDRYASVDSLIKGIGANRVLKPVNVRQKEKYFKAVRKHADFADITGSEAQGFLRDKEPGEHIFRNSANTPSAFSVSFVGADKKIHHETFKATSSGYQPINSKEIFKDLESLLYQFRQSF